MLLARASRELPFVPVAWGIVALAVAIFAPHQARVPVWGEFLCRCWFAAGGALFIATGWVSWWNGRYGLRAEPRGVEWHPDHAWWRGRLIRFPWSDIAAVRVWAFRRGDRGLLLLLRKGAANPLPARKGSRLVFVYAYGWRWEPREAKAAIERILSTIRPVR